MKKILVSMLAVAAIVACSTEQTVVAPANNDAIGFDTFVDKTTRANDVTTETIKDFGFGVYASVTNDDSKSSGLILKNEEVTYDGAWSYYNTQYWVPGNSYNFAAFAPFEGRHWTYETGNLAQNGVIAFDNATAEGEQDLVFAYAQRAKVAAGAQDKVGLTFSHLLSKVAFKFTSGYAQSSNIAFEVYGIKINNAVAEAEVEVEDGAVKEWAQVGDTTFVREFGKQAAEDVRLASAAAYATEHHYLLPIAKEYNITFNVDVYQAGVKVGTYPHTINTTINLAKGGNYNISATLNEKNTGATAFEAIEFTVDDVTEWVDNGYYVADGAYTVSDAQGLVNIAEDINNGTVDADATIELTGDIDLNDLTTRATASNWTPVGTSEKPFTGTFDGKGYTIKNLTLVESEAKEGKAYIGFFGYAKDATIKNVAFENVYINIPCLDIDHSQGHIGAVAGSLEGTSTIENVTVKGDINVYATQNANGASRVAVVAGGNSSGNVTMKNVHVIANEGSYLIANNNTGALAGQLQGKMVFENCSSNINVTANKFFAGGLVGIAAGDSYIKNCHTTGNVSVVAGREGRHNDEYRVGGIAGGWADGKTKVFTLEGCTYSGTLYGANTDGTVVENFDYAGYVGRGYTLANCAGSKVIIDGVEYVQKYDNVYGVYTIDGLTPVATADELVAALKANEGVFFLNDITVAATSGGYSKAGIIQNEAQTIDGNGYTLTVTGAGAKWDCAIYTNGGTIKNLTVAGAMRGIFTAGQRSDLNIENVTFKNVIYTFNSDGNMPANPFGVYVSDSNVNGWTSHSNMHTEVVYTNCSFGEGSGYKYCRPYGKTDFVNCTFCAGYTVDQSQTTEITFTDCTWEE